MLSLRVSSDIDVTIDREYWVIPEKWMANWKFSQEGGFIAQKIRAGEGI